MKRYHTLALRELFAQKMTSFLILIAIVLSTMMTAAVGQSAGVLAAIVFVFLMIRGTPVQSSDPFVQITYEIDGVRDSVGVQLDENDLSQAFGCFGTADIAEAANSQVIFDEYGHVSASQLQKAVETAVREAGGTVVSIERCNIPENAA